MLNEVHGQPLHEGRDRGGFAAVFASLFHAPVMREKRSVVSLSAQRSESRFNHSRILPRPQVTPPSGRATWPQNTPSRNILFRSCSARFACCCFQKNSSTAIHSRSEPKTSDGQGLHRSCPSSFRRQKTARLPPRPLLSAESVPSQETSKPGRWISKRGPPSHTARHHQGIKCPSALSCSVTCSGTTRKHPNGSATALQRIREAPASPTWATLPDYGL